jgi:hypothetical protein
MNKRYIAPFTDDPAEGESRYSGRNNQPGVILEEIRAARGRGRAYLFRDYQNGTTCPVPFKVQVKAGGYDVTVQTTKPVSTHGMRDALLLVFENELTRECYAGMPRKLLKARRAKNPSARKKKAGR